MSRMSRKSEKRKLDSTNGNGETKLVPENSSQKQQIPEQVLALVMDYDGCLAWNQAVLATSLAEDKSGTNKSQLIVKMNLPFIKNMVAIAIQNKFSEIRLHVGTNRQSPYRDAFNAQSSLTGSSFIAYEAIAQKIRDEIEAYWVEHPNEKRRDIPVTFDKLILADAYNRNLSGAGITLAQRLYQACPSLDTVKQACNKTHDAILSKERSKNGKICLSTFDGEIKPEEHLKEFPDFLWDDLKISLLYVLMHRVATLNPNKNITCMFFDDRKDILEGLEEFYSKNPDLIPRNLILGLFQYPNNPANSYTHKKYLYGDHRSVCDSNYKDNLFRWMAILKKIDLKQDFDSVKEVLCKNAKEIEAIKLANYQALNNGNHQGNFAGFSEIFKKTRQLILCDVMHLTSSNTVEVKSDTKASESSNSSNSSEGLVVKKQKTRINGQSVATKTTDVKTDDVLADSDVLSLTSDSFDLLSQSANSASNNWTTCPSLTSDEIEGMNSDTNDVMNNSGFISMSSNSNSMDQTSDSNSAMEPSSNFAYYQENTQGLFFQDSTPPTQPLDGSPENSDDVSKYFQ